ncbi:MAG: hypothetical protein MZU84_07615 [Sphingobacterium sp.]|nr:hypothetical protein [Sphingobacterium sp.]
MMFLRVFAQCIVMNVSANHDGELRLLFKTSPAAFGLIKDQDLSLNVSARNIPYKTYSFRMKSLNSYLTIPTTDLPEGIVMLTLRGSEMSPLCERLVYLQNNEDVRINLETSKTEYKQRDSVSLRMSLTGTSDSAMKALCFIVCNR